MWKTYKFEELILKIRKVRGIKTNQYSDTGKYPIIDQGNTFISGYTNNTESLYEDELPVVIFGDHTLSLKYVDFPFCAGADGTQILKPNGQIISGKFLYYSILQLNIQSLGYSRHFKVLKEATFNIPSLEHQKRIVRELDAADALRQKRKQAIALLDDYLKTVFLEMFGDPVINPKGWEIKEFHKICSKILGGGTPSKSNSDFYIGNIPWVTPKDMKKRFIDDSEDHISEEAVNNSSVKVIPQKSVLMVIRSGILKHTLPVAINDVEVMINQDMKAYVIDSKFSNPYFVLFFFEVYQNHLLKKVRAVTADNIKFDDIKSILMIVPPIELQDEFANIVRRIEAMRDKMIIQAGQIEANFNAVMQGAFNN